MLFSLSITSTLPEAITVFLDLSSSIVLDLISSSFAIKACEQKIKKKSKITL